MEQNTSVANAPATTSTGAEKVKSGNMSVGQATNLLMAMASKEAETKTAETKAAENVTPVEQAETTNPAAEASPPSDATTTETVETTETPAPEVEADNVPSQSNSFTPEQQDIFNKRIQREVAKTKAIQAESELSKQRIAELEAKLNTSAPAVQSQPSTPVVVQANQPLPNINDVAELQKFENTAKEAKRYATRILEDPTQWKVVPIPDNAGGTVDVKVHFIGDKPVTEAQMRSAKYDAEAALEDHIPAKRSFLTERTRFSQEAVQKFPFLVNKSTPEYQMVEAAKRDPRNAAILSMPNADYALGLMIEGQKAVEAREKAQKAASVAPVVKPKIVAKPSPDQTAVSASTAEARSPAGSNKATRQAQALANLKAKGNITKEDAAKFLHTYNR